MNISHYFYLFSKDFEDSSPLFFQRFLITQYTNQNIETTNIIGKKVIAMFNNCQYRKNIGCHTLVARTLSSKVTVAPFTDSIILELVFTITGCSGSSKSSKIWAYEKLLKNNHNQINTEPIIYLKYFIIFIISNMIK